MADDGKKEQSVRMSVTLYRSLILDKLRAEIAAKRAEMQVAKYTAIDLARQVDPHAIGSSYFKGAYFKMPYWKAGHMEGPDITVLPAGQAKSEK